MRINIKSFILGVVISIAVVSVIYLVTKQPGFPERNMVKYSGVDQFIVKHEYSDNHQSFIEVYISSFNKEKLLKKFPFQNNLDALSGELKCPFITEDNEHLYYVIKKGFGQFGYVLFSLEKVGNSFIVYQAFDE